MIIKRRTLFLVSLVILLVIIGYINHQLNKQSIKQASTDYEQYEAKLAEVYNFEDNPVQEISDETTISESSEDIEIVDSKQNEVEDLAQEVNSTIESTIAEEKNRKKINYFVEYRLSRDKMRANLYERLNKIIENDKTTSEIRDEAQKQVINLGRITEKELYIEGLIKSKGFEDALVFLTDTSARIVVSINNLNEQDVMKILEIVKVETGLEATQIKIMEKL